MAHHQGIDPNDGPHILSEDCPCKPRVTRHSLGTIVKHNKMHFEKVPDTFPLEWVEGHQPPLEGFDSAT